MYYSFVWFKSYNIVLIHDLLKIVSGKINISNQGKGKFEEVIGNFRNPPKIINANFLCKQFKTKCSELRTESKAQRIQLKKHTLYNISSWLHALSI